MDLKTLLLVSVCWFILGCGGAGKDPDQTRKEPDDKQKPEIIRVFACSDYCPKPKEEYMVNAYKGVTDVETCKKIGGRPYEFIGWGTYFVCLAD